MLEDTAPVPVLRIQRVFSPDSLTEPVLDPTLESMTEVDGVGQPTAAVKLASNP